MDRSLGFEFRKSKLGLRDAFVGKREIFGVTLGMVRSLNPTFFRMEMTIALG